MQLGFLQASGQTFQENRSALAESLASFSFDLVGLIASYLVFGVASESTHRSVANFLKMAMDSSCNDRWKSELFCLWSSSSPLSIVLERLVFSYLSLPDLYSLNFISSSVRNRVVEWLLCKVPALPREAHYDTHGLPESLWSDHDA